MSSRWPARVRGVFSLRRSGRAASLFVPGEVAGLFTVERRLGYGRFGQVWLVHHREWDVDLAVKGLHPHLRERERVRFTGEARRWVQMPLHPNLVTAWYVQEWMDSLLIVAEAVTRGTTLADRIRRRPLARGDVLDVAIQCCDGLGHVHDCGLVHGDFKPENLLLDDTGLVRLYDFGPACASDHYMSPEQALWFHEKGAEPDARTDQWSLGIVLYEMVVGETRRSCGDQARSEVEGDPRLSERGGPELRDLVLRCLEIEPSGRWDSIAAIGDRLRELYEKELEAPARARPGAVPRGADELNNQALSYLVLGDIARAQQSWREALQADPCHEESTFNLGLLGWRQGEMDDVERIHRMEALARLRGVAWKPRWLVGWAHVDRGDRVEAEKALRHAGTLAPPGRAELARAWEAAGALTCRRLRSFPHPEVTAVAFSPDGAHVLSGGGDGRIRLWDLRTGTYLLLEGHTDTVRALAFLPEGSQAASGGDDGHVCLWDLFPSPRRTSAWQGHAGAVLAVAFAPGGRVRSASRDGTIRLWGVESPGAGSTPSPHLPTEVQATAPGQVQAAALSCDAGLALLGIGATPCVCDLEATAPPELRAFLAPLQDPPHHVECLAFASDGTRALSGDRSGAIRLWEVPTGKCLRTLRGHSGPVRAVAFSPDGARALSGGQDQTLRLWELDSGTCLRTFLDHGGPVVAVAFSPEGKSALSGSLELDGMGLWDAGLASSRSLPYEPSRVRPDAIRTHAEFTAAVGHIVSAQEAGRIGEAIAELERARGLPGRELDPQLVELCNRLSLQARRSYRGLYLRREVRWPPLPAAEDPSPRPAAVRSAAFSPDLDWALLVGETGGMSVWRTGEEAPVRTFGDLFMPETVVALSPDGTRALGGGAPGFYPISLWDVGDGAFVRAFIGHQSVLRSVAFSPDGTGALSGSDDGTVRSWMVDSGECASCSDLEEHTGPVTTVAFSPDGTTALSGSMDGTLRWWDVHEQARTLHCRRVLTALGPVTTLAFSPCGRHALAGGEDGHVTWWELDTGEHRLLGASVDDPGTIARPQGSVGALAFSPDGSLALSAHEDGEVHLWDVQLAASLWHVRRARDRASSLAFSRDGRFAFLGFRHALEVFEFDWELQASPPDPVPTA